MTKDVLTIAWKEMQKRHFAYAIKLLEGRADIYEDNFEYYLILGIACLYVGDIGSASSYFQRARKLKLVDERLMLGQAAIFLIRGDTDRALQYYLEIQENNPKNITAYNAIEFIRTHGDYDIICRWRDTGRIEQFYPSLGANPVKIASFIIPLSACILGCLLVVTIVLNHKKNGPVRVDLSSLELNEAEKTDAREKDLSTQSYLFIFTDRDITKKYESALDYFQQHRDNASQIEVNTLNNSNASISIKEKLSVLASYYEIPDFDTITDVPSLEDVTKVPVLYENCWVNWGGKISNIQITENNLFTCDLLVGNEDLTKYEGSVKVIFDSTPSIDASKSVRILGKIVLKDNGFYIQGRSVYQTIY